MNVINSEIIDDLSGLLREADEKPWKIFRLILDCKREAFQRLTFHHKTLILRCEASTYLESFPKSPAAYFAWNLNIFSSMEELTYTWPWKSWDKRHFLLTLWHFILPSSSHQVQPRARPTMWTERKGIYFLVLSSATFNKPPWENQREPSHQYFPRVCPSCREKLRSQGSEWAGPMGFHDGAQTSPPGKQFLTHSQPNRGDHSLPPTSVVAQCCNNSLFMPVSPPRPRTLPSLR